MAPWLRQLIDRSLERSTSAAGWHWLPQPHGFPIGVQRHLEELVCRCVELFSGSNFVLDELCILSLNFSELFRDLTSDV